tara:strand:+ start:93 stop:377 length:285 start_codon:yes stop_codon:yes gene_type:complete
VIAPLVGQDPRLGLKGVLRLRLGRLGRRKAREPVRSRRDGGKFREESRLIRLGRGGELLVRVGVRVRGGVRVGARFRVKVGIRGRVGARVGVRV